MKTSNPKKSVFEVDSIRLTVLKTNPLTVLIHASGKTRTTDWTQPELIPRVYVRPPADGYYEFDFVALPPPGPAGQMITPIEVNYIWVGVPGNATGVRIFAETNNKQEPLKVKQVAEPTGVAAEYRTGISMSFNFEEALSNAISQFPPNNYIATEVVSINTSTGGFANEKTMMVTVKKLIG